MAPSISSIESYLDCYLDEIKFRIEIIFGFSFQAYKKEKTAQKINTFFQQKEKQR